MAANPPANSPPLKPWENAGGTSGPAPFKPPSPGSTSDIVEASGTARPGEIVSNTTTSIVNRNTVGRPMPSRPWEQSYGTTGYGTGGYGGFNYGLSYNSGYGGYGSTMGAGGMYGGGGIYGGGGMYGSSMYNRGGYGGGLYGSSGMYGGGMYGSGLGGPMGGYGMGGMGGPYGAQDPNNPHGPPSAPPGFWMSFLRVMEGVVNFFGRISILIDQNTQAVHLFMSALLQVFDRSGMLYGELARFVLRLLGVRTKPRKVQQAHGPPGGFPFAGPENGSENQYSIEQSKAAPAGGWDSVWGNDGS